MLALTDGQDKDSGMETVGPRSTRPARSARPRAGAGEGGHAGGRRSAWTSRRTWPRRCAAQLDSLETLAVETRGQYLPAKDAGQLGAIYQELAEIKAEYSLTYRSDRTLPDGTLRPIRVFYKQQKRAAGETAVYVRGMVVPAAGWSWLFLLLVGGIVVLVVLPGRLRART